MINKINKVDSDINHFLQKTPKESVTILSNIMFNTLLLNILILRQELKKNLNTHSVVKQF